MRLYSMYFLCKESIGVIENLKIIARTSSVDSTKNVINWSDCIDALNKLALIPSVKPAVIELYESVPIYFREKQQFEIEKNTGNKIAIAKKMLLSRMDTIIKLYENSRDEKRREVGFDIKLPDFSEFNEMVECMNDLKFILNQCPYLQIPESNVEYQSADIGSFWITFFVTGTAATALLLNLSKIVEAAVRIKSQVITVKQQEEQLRAMQEKNNLGNEIIDTFKQINKSLTDGYVRNIEAELGELPDREAADKLGKSIEKLGYWMDKGLQIYSAIDAPKDIKLLFPQQEEQKVLDDVVKFLEMSKNEDDGEK